MKLIAIHTILISDKDGKNRREVSPTEEFEVAEAEAVSLIERGAARKVKAKDKADAKDKDEGKKDEGKKPAPPGGFVPDANAK